MIPTLICPRCGEYAYKEFTNGDEYIKIECRHCGRMVDLPALTKPVVQDRAFRELRDKRLKIIEDQWYTLQSDDGISQDEFQWRAAIAKKLIDVEYKAWSI